MIFDFIFRLSSAPYVIDCTKHKLKFQSEPEDIYNIWVFEFDERHADKENEGGNKEGGNKEGGKKKVKYQKSYYNLKVGFTLYINFILKYSYVTQTHKI